MKKNIARSLRCDHEKRRKHRELILFIHGFNGSPDSTWGNFPNLIKGNKSLDKNYDVAFYCYKTSFQQGLRIQTLSKGLRTEINNYYLGYEKISIISHSMGGLVVRQYILEEFKDKKDVKINNLILYAVPNNGSHLAKYAVLFLGNVQLEQLKQGSDFIHFLNSDWARYQEQIYSDIEVRYVTAANDGVVDMESAQLYWGNDNTETIIDEDHRSIVKPKNEQSLSFVVAKNILLKKRPSKKKSPSKLGKIDSPDPNNIPTVAVYIENTRHNFKSKSRHAEKMRRAIQSVVSRIKNAKILESPLRADIIISSYLSMRAYPTRSARNGQSTRNNIVVEEAEVVVSRKSTKEEIYSRRIKEMVLEGVLYKIKNDNQFLAKVKHATTPKN